jgi:hypothetical protein
MILYAFYGTWKFVIVLIDPYNFTDVLKKLQNEILLKTKDWLLSLGPIISHVRLHFQT